MYLRLIAATLGAVFSLAAPALAADYRVTGLADTATGTCGAPDADGLRPCPSLRVALAAADGDGEDSAIVLGVPGTYTLSLGTLTLSGIVGVSGLGPRVTTLQGSGSRTVHVTPGAEAVLANLTIAGGSTTGDGGNILNEGSLGLFFARVTGGSATGSGGGIANLTGDLLVNQSLIDANSASSGGGIANLDGDVSLSDTTLTSDLYSVDDTTLTHVTLGPTAPFVYGDGTTTARATIFGGGCDGVPDDQGGNVDAGVTCALEPPSVSGQNPQLGTLVDRGGGTNVFAIAPTSPAAGLVTPCASPFDQRTYSRPNFAFGGACDAGAYEIAGTPAIQQPPPPPDPTPTPVPPQPTPTPTPTPAPRTNQNVRATEVKGTVLVKLKGSKRFVALDDALIGNGAEVDARKGTVEIATGAGEKARVSEGIFKIAQTGGLTTFTLSEKLTCPKPKRARVAAKKVKTRKLFTDGKGRFRTKGQYGAATVRGTSWRTSDTCTATTVRVTQGTITFRDLVKRKNIVVRKGKSATARAKR